jgi:hypothetical protein
MSAKSIARGGEQTNLQILPMARYPRIDDFLACGLPRERWAAKGVCAGCNSRGSFRADYRGYGGFDEEDLTSICTDSASGVPARAPFVDREESARVAALFK